jgi:hypothetical protein
LLSSTQGFLIQGERRSRGDNKERLRMLSPLRNPADRAESKADPGRPSRALGLSNEPVMAGSRANEASIDDDLARLEASLQWIRHAGTIAARAAGHGQNRSGRLPRATQLAPVSGISGLNIQAAGNGHRRVPSAFELAPPLACERIQSPAWRTQRAHSLRGALFVLIASAVVGSIVYHVSATGFPSAAEPAYASPIRGH